MENKNKEFANKIVNVVFLVTFLVAIVMSVVLIIVYLFRGGSKSNESAAPGYEIEETVNTAEPEVEVSEAPRYTEEQMAMLPEAEEIYAEIQRRIEIRDYYAIELYANQIPWYEDVAEIKNYYVDHADDAINYDTISDMLEKSQYDLDGYSVMTLCGSLIYLNDKAGFEDICSKGKELLVKLADAQYELGSYKTAASAYGCLNSLGAGDYGEKLQDSMEKGQTIEGEFSGKKYSARTFFMEDGLYICFTPKKGDTMSVYVSVFDGEWNFYFDANYSVTIDDEKMTVSSTGGMFDGEYRRKK